MAPEGAARLRREARANAVVVHPNLATIFGAETWNGVPMLIFELLEGGTLADRLRSGVLPVPVVLDLGIALAGVLDRAHDAGVLHRDIKPSNVGFSGEGVPKLLDFGLARIVEDHRRETPDGDFGRSATGGEKTGPTRALGGGTRAGVVVGTPSYVPPEALGGGSPGPAFDLWGLSLTLFESLTGANPFAGATVEETLTLVSAAALPPLRRSRPECVLALESLFCDALARDPRRRPPTARALRERLQAVEREA
jgi:serine/threonine protein kinase